jgi:hypothetical protein
MSRTPNGTTLLKGFSLDTTLSLSAENLSSVYAVGQVKYLYETPPDGVYDLESNETTYDYSTGESISDFYNFHLASLSIEVISASTPSSFILFFLGVLFVCARQRKIAK